MLKMPKRVTWVGVYGFYTVLQRINIFKASIFLTCKRNIIIYSQIRFQLYQSHHLTAIGLQIGKKSIHWVSVGSLETLWWVTLKLKL